ncbi:hypothetical protein P3T27_006625 [Kitasatospora sp. MAA19]|uniref:hypothetical protein n=1 Tax=Kitasatospora sp. MAA19 TaxID=3035090 RepID=UPI0024760E23|nr:hypothetical protein [Kitasatospora sp. MAA19]MDH6709876.1 hypothetical protein [Kitasatospora sp. MAA19]
MTGQLLRLLPARLLRALGYHDAHLDPAELDSTLEAAHTEAWAVQPADLRKALPNLIQPIHFQPGLVDLYRDQAHTTAYLNTLAAAAETNLDLTAPDQRALYAGLLAAARAAEDFERQVAAVAARSLPASPAPAELQHS